MPSSVIRRFTYDPDRQNLDVLFVTGRRYRYRTVPEQVVESFRQAFAKGRYFNARIRDRYPFEELDDDEVQASSSTSQ